MRKFKRFSTMMLALSVSVMSLGTVSFAQEKDVHVTILGTADTHSNLYGFSYEDGQETKNNGMARISTYVNEVRASNPNTILIDNGDTYQGTILADAIYNKKLDLVHPVSKVFNHLKYDAVILGNHEFNFGKTFVDKIIDELDMPVLGANVAYKDESEKIKPYTIIEKEGVKIGVIGLTNPNSPRWDGDKVDPFEFKDVVGPGKKYAKILKEEEKVDILVVSAHVGMIPEFDEDGGGDGAEKLLEEIPEMDVLLLGHYHTENAETIGNTLVGSPRNNGRDVVQFDLEIAKKDGKFVVTNKSVKTVDMETISPDQAVRDLIATEHQATIDFIDGSGDSEDGEGGGIFGQATADYQPKNEIQGIPQGKLQDTAVIDLIAKVQLDISGADVTAVALFQDKSDIKAGDINYGSLFNIYKFDNTLYTVDVTGKELVAYMEWSAKHYNTWKPGDISISFDENVPGYLYDMFEGVDYKVDLSKPAGERIVDVMYKGQPLKEDQMLKLALNNYRYSSGVKAQKLVAANRDWESPKAIRDYIADYILEEGKVTPEVSNNWEIVGVDLNHALRDEVIELVNNGKLEVPYNKSLNIKDLESQGIIKDGKVIAPIVDVDQELSHSEGPTKKPDTKKDPVTEEVVVEQPQAEKNDKVIYVVKPGDYLIKIANIYNTTYRKIAKDNGIKNPNLIYVNQKLEILLP